jgi:DNA polymerase-1
MYQDRGIDIKQLNIPEGVFEYTPFTFEEEYGLKPIQMIDKKAIEGDSSDNIPGVKNVGGASAIPLIKEYGTLENIYEVIETESEKELKEFFNKELGIKRSPIKNLIEQKEIAFLSKKLATIKTDLEPFNSMDLSELELNLNKEKIRASFEDLEFKSLLEKI